MRCQAARSEEDEAAKMRARDAKAAAAGRPHTPGAWTNGSVVIAAITSCTNTSNPSVHARRRPAREESGRTRPADQAVGQDEPRPGSKAVTDYLIQAGVMRPLEQLALLPGRLWLHHLHRQQRSVAGRGFRRPSPITIWSWPACCRGNRNFEGRIHPEVRANYLASPPLVVAYALAGRDRLRLRTRSRSAQARDGQAGLPARTSGRRSRKCATPCDKSRPAGDVQAHLRRRVTRATSTGSSCRCPTGDRYAWEPESTYVKHPPYFENMPPAARRRSTDIDGARVLAVLGDSITTDHISPAGSIKKDSPAGQYLIEQRRPAGRLQSATAPAAAITRSWSAAPSPTSA